MRNMNYCALYSSSALHVDIPVICLPKVPIIWVHLPYPSTNLTWAHKSWKEASGGAVYSLSSSNFQSNENFWNLNDSNFKCYQRDWYAVNCGQCDLDERFFPMGGKHLGKKRMCSLHAVVENFETSCLDWNYLIGLCPSLSLLSCYPHLCNLRIPDKFWEPMCHV